jgi:hypothetical protein
MLYYIETNVAKPYLGKLVVGLQREIPRFFGGF